MVLGLIMVKSVIPQRALYEAVFPKKKLKRILLAMCKIST